MAVPKRKQSKSRQKKRYANWKISLPGLSACSHCRELKTNHRVCPTCGYYDGAKKVDTAKKKAAN